jgi:hypothetical protein
MKIATGKVIGGKVVVEGDALTEGATVTVVARESDETFEVSPEQEAALLDAIAEADRGNFVSPDQILENLRRPV